VAKDPTCYLERKHWRIGIGGIQRGDIVIVGVVNVSPGSWVPILQLAEHPYGIVGGVKNWKIDWGDLFNL
jgi:hypothetical protein